jgi:hypothetical protein
MTASPRLDAIRAGILRLQERLQSASEEHERNELRRALADAHARACLAEEEILLDGGGDLAAAVRRWQHRAEEYGALSDAAESDRDQRGYRQLAEGYQALVARAEARARPGSDQDQARRAVTARRAQQEDD